MMVKLTDKILMAYVDGELENRQNKEIRKAIETDPEALKRVEIFRGSSALLRSMYDKPFQESVPKQLIDTAIYLNTDKPASTLFERLLAFLRIRQNWEPVYAIVASVALFIGVSTGYIFSTNISNLRQGYYGIKQNDENLSRGLETTVSGQFFIIKNRNMKIIPVATFIDKSNRYCRQYDVVATQNKDLCTSRGIACRTKSGKWLTLVSINAHAFDTSATHNNSGFIQAGGDELIDKILSQIMTEPPMALKKESELIGQSWTNAPN
jgi:surface antigen